MNKDNENENIDMDDIHDDSNDSQSDINEPSDDELKQSDKFFDDMFNSSMEEHSDDSDVAEDPLPEFDEDSFYTDSPSDDKTEEPESSSLDDSDKTEPIIAAKPINEGDDTKSEESSVPMTRAESKRQEKKKKRKKKTIAISSIAALVLVAGVGGYFGFNYIQNADTTTVPSAMKKIDYNQDSKDACQTFVKAELKCQVKWEVNDSSERGELLAQSVASGEKIDNDSDIVLKYSNGPSVSEFPNLNNVNIEEAKRTLYDLNVEVSEVKEVDGKGIDSGNIVSTSIKPGDEVNNGDSVNIEVSNGKVELPDWSGKTKEYVEADADKLGINVKFTEEESDKASGIVISQTPKAGEANTSTEVNVVISKAFKAKEIEIPDVIGKTAEKAQTDLATAGFRQIKTVKVKNEEVTETQVTQVVPGVGKKGNSEENIVIIVSEPIK